MIKKAASIAQKMGVWPGSDYDSEDRNLLVISFVLAAIFAVVAESLLAGIIIWFVFLAAYNTGRSGCKRAIARASNKRLKECGVSKEYIDWLHVNSIESEIDEQLAGKIIADNAIRRISAGEAADYEDK